ncbi:MAG: Nif3-like dinuclear metal center hexameric protein [Fimbriimonadaceae bacterium]
MATVRDILEAIETIAPPQFALPGDKIGLQIGEADACVTRAQVSLDRSFSAVSACVASRSQLLLTHHPIVWQPLTSVVADSDTTVCVRELVTNRINLIAAHTNWDCAHGGVNDALATKLGLEEVTPFGPCSEYKAMKLVTFAPEESADGIISAAAAAGAGAQGDYRRCAFLNRGEGMFDARDSANPARGKPGKRNLLPEVRIEMELPPACRAAVEAAVLASHPYESPSLDFIFTQKLGVPLGRKGRLPQSMSVDEFLQFLNVALGTKAMAWDGGTSTIEAVAVVGGAGDDTWQAAQAAGCEALVTGEVKQHIAVEASGWGISIFAAGHYATEQPGVEALAAAMRTAVPEVEWNVFVPDPGNGGRPLT